MRQKHRGLERIPDRVAETAFPLQTGILCGAGRLLRVHEEHDAQFFRFGPERIELAVRQFLSFDAAADRGATKAQFSHRVVELLGGEIRMLQRKGRHADEAIRLRGDRLSNLFVLQLDQVPRQRALR